VASWLSRPFVSGWDAMALKACVAFGVPDQETLAPPESVLERRYAVRAIKQRLHQASFREAVITAYSPYFLALHVGDIDVDSVTCQSMQPCGSGQNGYASLMRLAAL
jgi:hypothetical protein